MFKKIMALLLAAMMAIGMTIPAFADGLHLSTNTVENDDPSTENTDSGEESITIQEALSDETYTIYQILELDEEGYRVCEGWEGFLISRTVGEDALFILTDTGYLDPESPIFELWQTEDVIYGLTDEAFKWAEDNDITGVSVFLTEEFELEPEGVAVVANVGEYKNEKACDLTFRDLSPGVYLVNASFGFNSIEATANQWDDGEEDKIQVIFTDPTAVGYYDEDGYYHVELESCVSVIVDGIEMSYSEFLEYHDNGYGHDVMIFADYLSDGDAYEDTDENGWWVFKPGDYELCVSISRHKLSSTTGNGEEVFAGYFSYYFTVDPIEGEDDSGEDGDEDSEDLDKDKEGEENEDDEYDSEGGEDEDLEGKEDNGDEEDETPDTEQEKNDDESGDEEDEYDGEKENNEEESGDEEDEYDGEKENNEEDDVITVYEGDQYEDDRQIEDDEDWDDEDENGNWDGGEYYEEEYEEEAGTVESSAPLKTGVEDYLPYILTFAAASIALLIYAVQKKEEDAQ